MGFSLNKVMLIGNLGQDAEHSFTNNNVSVTKFSIATVHSYKDKSSDTWKDETTWHNVVGFNLSDFYKDALKKGAKMYVEGRLTKRDYTDKEGIKRYSTDVLCSSLIPLGDKNNTNQSNNDRAVSGQNRQEITEDDPDGLPF